MNFYTDKQGRVRPITIRRKVMTTRVAEEVPEEVAQVPEQMPQEPTPSPEQQISPAPQQLPPPVQMPKTSDLMPVPSVEGRKSDKAQRYRYNFPTADDVGPPELPRRLKAYFLGY